MSLDVLWFILIAVLYTGYFVLEGFDYGVGMLMPFLGKNDEQRRLIINSIGPFWDGNEVWLLTAGGATFAAFPNWYATLFSGFYLALFLMLLALIGRGVAFEFRSKVDSQAWRNTWDWVIFTGSLLPALLWGVALANLMQGVPIDAQMNFTGNFFTLLSPYTVVGGLSMVLMFALHGALFLSLRTVGELQVRARQTARRVGMWTTIVMFVFVLLSYFFTDMFTKIGVDPGPVPVLAGLVLISVAFFIRVKKDGWAFAMTSVTIVLSTATIFLGLFPRVMVSSTNPAWSLTIYNASSSHYTLTVMTIVAFSLVPIVLAYQIWTYWVFRKRLQPGGHLDY
ncbi:cytochrome d ubiquinol oxidase subunit II [Alicyclobacillaceae bacterium I2511]|nr:cytochrome d ubiquinol oxidase subunit II [Alicyclobacillaceae bacterium I2511]